MKSFLLKNKWLISIGVFLIFIIIVLLILIKTDSLNIFYDSVNNKIRSISIISLIVLIIAFIADVIKGWISNYITDFIFPGAEKKILKNTNEIKSNTSEMNKKLETQSKNVDIIAGDTKQILENINNKNINSYKEIWNSLRAVSDYYNRGMDIDLQKYGTLKLIPIVEFREIVSKSKMNIDVELYRKLEILYSDISKKTTKNIFEPMKLFLNNKTDLFPNEIEKIQLDINKSRIEILKFIENFMQNNKKQLRQ